MIKINFEDKITLRVHGENFKSINNDSFDNIEKIKINIEDKITIFGE